MTTHEKGDELQLSEKQKVVDVQQFSTPEAETEEMQEVSEENKKMEETLEVAAGVSEGDEKMTDSPTLETATDADNITDRNDKNNEIEENSESHAEFPNWITEASFKMDADIHKMQSINTIINNIQQQLTELKRLLKHEDTVPLRSNEAAMQSKTSRRISSLESIRSHRKR